MKVSAFLVYYAFFTGLLSYSIFLLGFFPVKSSIQCKGSTINFRLDQHSVTQPNRKIDRTIVVLIDALRADFVKQHDRMPFLREKVTNGFGYTYVAKAHPPTVTLPRIKALTSGSIPGFVDVVLNFDSKSLKDDNIITQAFDHGRNIVFYGDDTWIRLFPDHFVRSEGTTSFFVTDYTEVDDNVTRHISAELSAPDWDLMILHYLGLDHIGHTAGPRSPLVPPKLLEMDHIIKHIYTTLEHQGDNFVLLVCGDHGMSDQGSHGGASDSEVLVPAVFLSPSYTKQSQLWRSHHHLLQIDLAPTLSVMMGLPIPSNNLGQVLLEPLPGLGDLERLASLYVNSQQIIGLMQQNVANFEQEGSFEMFQSAVSSHSNCLSSKNCSIQELTSIYRKYETALELMSSKIAASLTTYDIYSMILAIGLLVLNLMLLILTALSNDQALTWKWSPIGCCCLSVILVFGHMMACTSQSVHSPAMCGWSLYSVGIQMFILISCNIAMVAVWSICSSSWTTTKRSKIKYGLTTWLWVGTVLHSLSFGSSSFVEEEHQTWYHLTMTLYLTLTFKLCYSHIKQVFSYKIEPDSQDIYTLKKYDLHQNSRDSTGVLTRSASKKMSRSNHELTDRQTSARTFNDDPKEDQNVLNRKSAAILQTLPVSTWLPWKQSVALVTVMLLGRLMRTLNQTGNKWLDTPDFGDYLIRPENKTLLTVVTILSLLVMLVINLAQEKLELVCFILGLIANYQYRVAIHTVSHVISTSNTRHELSQGKLEARIVYLMVLVINIISVMKHVRNKTKMYQRSEQNQHSNKYSEQSNGSHFSDQTKKPPQTGRHNRTETFLNCIKTFHLSWVLLMVLLLRTHNTLLVAMVVTQEWLLWRFVIKDLRLPAAGLALLTWWIGQAGFFQQGNSNSISTVDVSSGYVGLTDYQPVLVGLLLFLSTYAAPMFWLISLLKYILHSHSNTLKNSPSNSPTLGTSLLQCIHTLAIERLLTLVLYCIIVTSQRYHLFVWTVFSPKLLYEGMLTVMFSVFVIIAAIINYCQR